jgi:hypothetical protein
MSHHVILLPKQADVPPRRIDGCDIPANTTGVRLGWDPPLKTFFAIVQTERANPEQEDPITHLWVGTTQGELTTVDALQAAITTWLTLPTDLHAQLVEDQHQNI